MRHKSDSKGFRILVTQGELKQTLAVVRELGRNGHFVEVISLGRHSMHGIAIASFSKYCRRHHKVSTYINEKQFINEVIDIIKNEKYDFIIPIGAPFVEWLVRNKAVIEQHAIVPFPSEEKIKNLENKKFTTALAKQLCIPIPFSIYPNSIEQVMSESDIIQYPVVIKANKEVGGNIVEYAYNKNELIEKYKEVVKKYNLYDDLPVLQEYLTGRGAGFFALYVSGKFVQGFQHHRVREYPLSGGSSTCAQSVSDDLVLEYGKRILDETQWDGVAMVEFKYNAKGIPCFLEINPKFWGSYDLSVKCGVNFAHKLVLSKKGLPFNAHDSYKSNVIVSWPFNGDFQHCYESGETVKLLMSLVSGKVKSNFEWSDISGSLAIFMNWVLQLGYKFYSFIKRVGKK